MQMADQVVSGMEVVDRVYQEYGMKPKQKDIYMYGNKVPPPPPPTPPLAAIATSAPTALACCALGCHTGPNHCRASHRDGLPPAAAAAADSI